MLLSYVVDSAIELSTELGDYDHLVFTNPKWIENFGDSGKLKPIEYSSLSKSMQEFLDSQMPILTNDGSVLPEGTGLYEYEGGGLLAFPINVTLGSAKPISGACGVGRSRADRSKKSSGYANRQSGRNTES